MSFLIWAQTVCKRLSGDDENAASMQRVKDYCFYIDVAAGYIAIGVKISVKQDQHAFFLQVDCLKTDVIYLFLYPFH